MEGPNQKLLDWTNKIERIGEDQISSSTYLLLSRYLEKHCLLSYMPIRLIVKTNSYFIFLSGLKY